ncbi:MAG: hypothetical protein JWQ98_3266 [Chlorobi bacterium]|nr:hypothetical protein [Chlorobiota bacterium]
MRDSVQLLSIVAVAIISIVLCAGCGEPGPTIGLGLHLEKGKRYGVSTVTDQSIMGEMKMRQSVGLWTNYAVEDVDAAGNATVRVTYDSAAFSQTTDSTVSYHSGDTTSEIPPAAAAYISIVGHGFGVKIAPGGRVMEVIGGDALRQAIIDRMSGSNKFLSGVIDQNLRTMFSDSALKLSIGQMLAFYPPKPVAVGDSWTSKGDIGGGFPMTLENEYTLKSRGNGVAVVELKSKIEPTATPAAADVSPISYDITGAQKGTMEIDERSGWMMKSEQTEEFSGMIRQRADSGSATGGEMPVSVRGTTVTKSWEMN